MSGCSTDVLIASAKKTPFGNFIVNEKVSGFILKVSLKIKKVFKIKFFINNEIS